MTKNKFHTLFGGFQNMVQLTSEVNSWMNLDAVPRSALLNKVAALIVRARWDITKVRHIDIEKSDEATGMLCISTVDDLGATHFENLFTLTPIDLNQNFISYRRPDVLIPVVRIIAFADEPVPKEIAETPQKTHVVSEPKKRSAAEVQAEIDSLFTTVKAEAGGPIQVDEDDELSALGNEANLASDQQALPLTPVADSSGALEPPLPPPLPSEPLATNKYYSPEAAASAPPEPDPTHDRDLPEKRAAAFLHEQVLPFSAIGLRPKKQDRPKSAHPSGKLS